MSSEALHRRLGNLSLDKFKRMVPHLSHLQTLDCGSCQLGKHARVYFPSSVNSRATSPFDIVHSDVWGPSRVPTILDYKYYVIFINDFSRCTWLFLLKDRSELLHASQKFYLEIQNQFGKTIRVLCSDNAKEYLSPPFKSFLASTVLYTDQRQCTIEILG